MFVFGSNGAQSLPQIANSLRFNAAASQSVSRTYTTSATSTFFFCCKRGKLGTISPILGTYIKFNANDTLTAFGTTTSAVFRDPIGWYYGWVSNSGTYMSIGAGGTMVQVSTCTTSVVTNAAWGYDGTNYFDGNLAFAGIIDGSNVAYTSGGYTDVNAQWRTKGRSTLIALTAAGGAASTFLPFDDGTSTITLGQDASGKGNNWTLTNFTRSAGVNDCWMTDTPTNNFCVLSAISGGSSNAIVNGALKNYTASAAFLNAVGSIPLTYKTYWEGTIETTTGASNAAFLGLINSALVTAGRMENIATTAGVWFGTTVQGWQAGSGTFTVGSAAAAGTVVQLSFDPATGKFWVGQSNLWYDSAGGTTGNPSTGANPTFTLSTAIAWMPVSHVYADGIDFNFGQRALSYTPPTGFKALNTANIPIGAVITSGTFTGNLNADGPYIWLNGEPLSGTINGNAITWGTHADKLAGGIKIRTASSSYNNTGSNTFVITTNNGVFKYQNAAGNP